MADDKEDAKVQQQNREIREHLNDAYAALEGQKSIQTFAAFTFADALDAQIESIEGKDTKARPNDLHRVDRIESRVIAAIAKIKAMPATAFNPPDNKADANTAP